MTNDREDAHTTRTRVDDYHRLAVLEADLESVPLPDDSIELITAHGLCNVLDPATLSTVAAELTRVAAPGCHLVVDDYDPLPDDAAVREIFAVGNAASELARGRPVLTFYPAEFCRRLFTGYGWTVERERTLLEPVPWTEDHLRAHRDVAKSFARDVDDAVEFWDWRDKDLDAIIHAADEADLDLVGCVAGGELTDPGAADDAVATIRESIETASDLGIPTLIATTGPDQEDLDSEIQHENIVNVLSQVAPDAEEADVTIALEPLNNAVDRPGYYLSTSEEGFQIVDEVDSPGVKLLYDIYHQQITEGNVIQTITENVKKIGHIHVADVPGRHEPGTGELNCANIFDAIDEAGYDGYLGCEFSPTGDPPEAMATVLDLA